MNEFQKERHQIFENRKLSEERKYKVLEAVHAPAKRKKQWVPAVAITFVLGIGSFLLFAPEQLTEETEMNQAFTTEALAEAFQTEFQIENMELLIGQIPFLENNDSFIIVKELTDGDLYYRFIHGKFQKDKWHFEEQTMLSDDYPMGWETMIINNQMFKIGIVEDEAIENIFVGSEAGTMVRAREGVYVWFGKSMTPYTPVYKQVKGNLHRIASFNIPNVASSLPFIEPIGDKQTILYQHDTMIRGNDEYRKFPIVLDPYYYAQNSFRAGDVIAYDRDGQIELTRILSIDAHLQLINDTFVYESLDDPVPDFFYFWPTYNGNTGWYKNLNEKYSALNKDEVFVSPDNWSSDGYRGAIKKEQIIGKVLGYDLNGVTNTMTQSEMNRYQVVKELAQDKEINNNLDTLTSFLKDASPQQIAQLYYYASYMQDTKTMYALLTQQKDVLPPYEEWLQHQSTPTKSMRQHQLVKLYYTNKATMNEQTNRLEFRDSFTQELLFNVPMQKEDDVWKVVYSTISDNSK